MKLTYDPKYNIAYIKFRNKTSQVKTISLSAEVNIDLSADGKIAGIELLNANEQLRTSGNNLSFVNELTGDKLEMPLQGV